MPAGRVARALAGAFQDFFRFELPRPHRSGSATCRASTTTRPSSPPSAGPGPTTWCARLRVGPGHPARADLARGVEVSFGQWQKLALARGFMRDEPLLLVLDEPTAALDAETEHALFERYAAARPRTASRRRAASRSWCRTGSRTVRMADLIVVLDGAGWPRSAATRT